jgi:hypothetical protein
MPSSTEGEGLRIIEVNPSATKWKGGGAWKRPKRVIVPWKMIKVAFEMNFFRKIKFIHLSS